MDDLEALYRFVRRRVAAQPRPEAAQGAAVTARMDEDACSHVASIFHAYVLPRLEADLHENRTTVLRLILAKVLSLGPLRILRRPDETEYVLGVPTRIPGQESGHLVGFHLLVRHVMATHAGDAFVLAEKVDAFEIAALRADTDAVPESATDPEFQGEPWPRFSQDSPGTQSNPRKTPF